MGFDHDLLVKGWKNSTAPIADLMVPYVANGVQVGMLVPVFTGGELLGWDAGDVEVIAVYQVVDTGRRVILETLQPMSSFEKRYFFRRLSKGKCLSLMKWASDQWCSQTILQGYSLQHLVLVTYRIQKLQLVFVTQVQTA